LNDAISAFAVARHGEMRKDACCLNISHRHDNGALAMEEVPGIRAAEDTARVGLNRPEAKNAFSAGMRAFAEKHSPVENYQTA
jgi:hypothetical protein